VLYARDVRSRGADRPAVTMPARTPWHIPLTLAHSFDEVRAKRSGGQLHGCPVEVTFECNLHVRVMFFAGHFGSVSPA
jgi:hypothetical protein